ncbi:hypothetical protein M436DRAFT_80015 [Aureobasidium namibiae CBS 147.97]|uniref:Uncharacterized protein n=1 Tax=Aureobasidium namibiae CBS 147.97 TaxID=1043004 RepID=A0A074XM46_9PEZI
MADTQNSSEAEIPGYNDTPVREIRAPFSAEEAKISKPLLKVLVQNEVIVRYAWYLEPPKLILHVVEPNGAEAPAS